MRDVNRIKPFLKELGDMWEEMPDLRFGQIIYLLADEIGRDIFFPEDKEWIEKINKVRENNNYVKGKQNK